MTDPGRGPTRRWTRWLWFAAWAAIGCGVAFAGISVAGPLTAPVVLVAIALLIWRRGLDRTALGVVSGMGIMLLVVAYLQRKGPGTVYWHTATASGSDTYLDPRPWLIAGLVLLAAGLAAFALLERRAQNGLHGRRGSRRKRGAGDRRRDPRDG